MKVLINLSTLKKGGGQNVGLNFLESLLRINIKDIDFHFTCVKNSAIHIYLQNEKISNITFMPSNPIKRMLKEFILGRSILKSNNIDIIYTYFGIGLYTKSIPQISGSADSNIYFPEIDFWKEYNGVNLIFKKIIDEYRIWGLKRMEAIIFENEIMQKRGEEIFKLKKTKFIKPSINNQHNSDKSLYLMKKKNTGLFLCGWHRNKNFMIIPKLAHEFKKLNIEFNFILTAPIDNSLDYRNFIKETRMLDVEDRIRIIGQIKKDEICSLYEQIDFVFLLSKLESFSNNIIEAWYFKKPLIISNELWAQSICKDSAIYVNRDDSKNICDKVIDLIKDEKKIQDLIDKSQSILKTYPTLDTRTNEEINFIKEIYESF